MTDIHLMNADTAPSLAALEHKASTIKDLLKQLQNNGIATDSNLVVEHPLWNIRKHASSTTKGAVSLPAMNGGRNSPCSTAGSNADSHASSSSKYAATSIGVSQNVPIDELSLQQTEKRARVCLEQIKQYCDNLKGSRPGSLKDGHESDSSSRQTSYGKGLPPPIPAVSDLMKLSFDDKRRHVLSNLGVLCCLADLLCITDRYCGPSVSDQNLLMLRRYACLSLTQLTQSAKSHTNNKDLLCKNAAALTALTNLIECGEDMSQIVASLFRNLSWRSSTEAKIALGECGVVRVLATAVQESQKEATLKSVLSAIWNLSAHCSENKIAICEVNGFVSFLARTLSYDSPSKSLSVVESAGGILRNVSSLIATRSDLRAVLRRSNCLPILLNHLRSSSVTIVSNASGVLWNLSAHSDIDQQILIDNGAAAILQPLTHSKQRMIATACSAALKNLMSAHAKPVAYVGPYSHDPTVSNQSQGASFWPPERPVPYNAAATSQHQSISVPRSVDPPANMSVTSHISNTNCTACQIHSSMHRSFTSSDADGFRQQSFRPELPPPRQSTFHNPVHRASSQESLHSGRSDGLVYSHQQQQQRQRRSSGERLAQDRPHFQHPPFWPPNVEARTGHDVHQHQEMLFHQRFCYLHQHTDRSDQFYHNTSQTVQTQQQGYLSNANQNCSSFHPSEYGPHLPPHLRQPHCPCCRAVHPVGPHASLNHSTFQSNNRLQQSHVVNHSMHVPRGAIRSNEQPRTRLEYENIYSDDIQQDESPTDFSQKYAERSDEVSYAARIRRHLFPNGEPPAAVNFDSGQQASEDTLQTFATEGTPSDFLSAATSMQDLSVGRKLGITVPDALSQQDTSNSMSSSPSEGDSAPTASHSTGKRDGEDSAKHYPHGTNSSHLSEPKSGTSATVTSAPSDKPTLGNSAQFYESQEISREQTDYRNIYNDDHPDVCESDKLKTYCVEGTPQTHSHYSSLSSLHCDEESNANLNPKGNDSKKPDRIRYSNTQQNVQQSQQQHTMHAADNNGSVNEKESKTVHFGEQDIVMETPMMFSRCSSLGSLDSFDVHSVHSSVYSEYSRRASEVVSPSDLPDSPSDTMPPSRAKSPTSNHRATKISSADSSITPSNGDNERLLQKSILKKGAVDGESKAREILSTIPETIPLADDSPKVYADEKSPVELSVASSLSALTFEDEVSIAKDSDLSDHRYVIDLNDDTLKATDSLQDSTVVDISALSPTVNHVMMSSDTTNITVIENKTDDKEASGSDISLSDNAEADQAILAECINSAMPTTSGKKKSSGGGSRHRSSLTPKQYSQFLKIKEDRIRELEAEQHQETCNSNVWQPQASQQLVTTNAPTHDFSVEQSYSEDTVKVYAVEGTPFGISAATSLSSLNVEKSATVSELPDYDVASPETSKVESEALDVPSGVSAPIEAEQNTNDYISDSELFSDSSGDEEKNNRMLDELIRSAMPAPRKKQQPQILSPGERIVTGCEAKDLPPPVSISSKLSLSVEGQSQDGKKKSPKTDISPGLSATSSSYSSKRAKSENRKLEKQKYKKAGAKYQHKLQEKPKSPLAKTISNSGGLYFDYGPVDSPKTFAVEGTPISFSRADSLSSLSQDDDDKGLLPKKEREKLERRSQSEHRPPKPQIDAKSDRRINNSAKSSALSPPTKSLPPSGQAKAVYPNERLHTRKVDQTNPIKMTRNLSFGDKSPNVHLESPTHQQMSRNLSFGDKSTAEFSSSAPLNLASNTDKDNISLLSNHSSLSSLSIDSHEQAYAEQLLQECIKSAMPKSTLSPRKICLIQAQTEGIPPSINAVPANQIDQINVGVEKKHVLSSSAEPVAQPPMPSTPYTPVVSTETRLPPQGAPSTDNRQNNHHKSRSKQKGSNKPTQQTAHHTQANAPQIAKPVSASKSPTKQPSSSSSRSPVYSTRLCAVSSAGKSPSAQQYKPAVIGAAMSRSIHKSVATESSPSQNSRLAVNTDSSGNRPPYVPKSSPGKNRSQTQPPPPTRAPVPVQAPSSKHVPVAGQSYQRNAIHELCRRMEEQSHIGEKKPKDQAHTQHAPTRHPTSTAALVGHLASQYEKSAAKVAAAAPHGLAQKPVSHDSRLTKITTNFAPGIVSGKKETLLSDAKSSITVTKRIHGQPVHHNQQANAAPTTPSKYSESNSDSTSSKDQIFRSSQESVIHRSRSGFSVGSDDSDYALGGGSEGNILEAVSKVPFDNKGLMIRSCYEGTDAQTNAGRPVKQKEVQQVRSESAASNSRYFSRRASSEQRVLNEPLRTMPIKLSSSEECLETGPVMHRSQRRHRQINHPTEMARRTVTAPQPTSVNGTIAQAGDPSAAPDPAAKSITKTEMLIARRKQLKANTEYPNTRGGGVRICTETTV